MNFKDNLQKLRKKHGLSQEALAEQLDVTRQSVSKWESGISYPEMDKLLSICKIFSVDMDTLLNGDVSKEKEVKTKDTKKILSKFDTVMKKVVYFLDHMTVKKFLSLLVTLAITIFVLYLLYIPLSMLDSFVAEHLFFAIDNNFISILYVIWNFIYLLLSVVIVIYVLKIKYFDKIIFVEEGTDHKDSKSKDIEIESQDVEKQIIVTSKEKEHKNQKTFIDLLLQIIVYFVKFLVILFLLWCGFVIILMTIGLGFSIFLLIKGFPLLSIIMLLLGALCLSSVIFLIPLNFLIDHANSFKQLGILLLVSLGLFIFGGSVLACDLFNMTYINEAPTSFTKEEKTYTYQMTDDLSIEWLQHTIYYGDLSFETDNSLLDNIKIVITYYDVPYLGSCEVKDYENTLYLTRNEEGTIFKMSDFLKMFGDDIKDKKIYNYSKLEEVTITIYGSEENIIKLKESDQSIQ